MDARDLIKKSLSAYKRYIDILYWVTQSLEENGYCKSVYRSPGFVIIKLKIEGQTIYRKPQRKVPKLRF